MYSNRYGHLEKVCVIEGQRLKYGDYIGIVGNTGDSTGTHLDLMVVEGHVDYPSYSQIDIGNMVASKRQVERFLNNQLFNSPYRITTPYLDPNYNRPWEHWGYDAVPIYGKNLYWSIPNNGIVRKTGYNSVLGNYIVVWYYDDITEWNRIATEYLLIKGIIQGDEKGKINPDDKTIAMIYNSIK